MEHGTHRGRGLSERRFVEDKAELMGGRPPSRPYFETEEQIDTSLAAVVVMDQSDSMGSLLVTATQAFIALIEPLDGLGCATMGIGFRDGHTPYHSRQDRDPDRNYHRTGAVHIDVFKAFHEKFNSVKWRFANTTASGGTPMSDGTQMALEALSERPEGHRVVFVVTDGMPNHGHAEVIRHQTRIAKESGILMVGVGIGLGSRQVIKTFPDHVYAPTIGELPALLIEKLNQIMDFRGLKRGLRLRRTT